MARILTKVACVVLVLVVLMNLVVPKLQAQDVLPPLKIVQLGDSYSAGNGARDASGDRNYTGVEGCYRSPTNWGSQFAEALREQFTVTYINRACSGGVIADIMNERVLDEQLKNLDGSCPAPDFPDEEILRNTSTLKCTRSLEAQIDAIDESVDLVIMTMGGNDVGFASVVERCFVRFRRGPTECRERVEQAMTDLASVEANLLQAFKEIREELGTDGRVAFVSYPYLAPDVDRVLESDDVEPYPYTQEIRVLGREGDLRQRAAVDAANAAAGEDYIVYFDRTKDLFEGHVPDPVEENPAQWLYGAYSTRVTLEWYHYNPLGHQNLGDAVALFGSFGAIGGTFERDADIDVAFVVDTTGSMGDEIAQVRDDLSNIVGQLAAMTNSYRVAVVSYRDFPERTGDSNDYPARVDLGFTNNLTQIQSAIDSLVASGGGDTPETVFSGVKAAIDLPWRPGVTKTLIVIGDAPALSPEPVSNLTAAEIVAASVAVDPVQVHGVDVYDLNSNNALGEIAAGTGGSIIPSSSDVPATIVEILSRAAEQPFAWLGAAYAGPIGEPLQFDASGSYDPSGTPLTLYEWDFDNDGVYDLQTESPTAAHTYDAPYEGYVVVRVTGAGGTALASARTVVNAEGSAPQGDELPCELDADGFSIIIDEEGQSIRCTATSLPEKDRDGIIEREAIIRVLLPIVQQ